MFFEGKEKSQQPEERKIGKRKLQLNRHILSKEERSEN